MGTLPIVSIVVGIIFGWLFARRQRRLNDPLVDFSLFRNRAFATVVVAMMLITVIGSLMFFTAQYLQLVAGLSPLQAGMAMLPAAITAAVSFGGSPLVAQRVRPAYTIAGGMAVAAVGCLLYIVPDGSSPADNPTGLVSVVTGLAVMNLGCGPMVTLGTGIVVSSVPSTKAGAASAMSEASAEFGYGLGLATMGSIGTLVYRAQFEPGTGTPANLAAQARESLAAASNAAAELGAAGDGLFASARDAFMTSVHAVGGITAGIAVLIGVLALTNLRHLRPLGAEPDDDQGAETESSVSGTADG